MSHRVAVTGIGCILPSAIEQDEDGVMIKRVADENIEGHMSFDQWRRMDRFCRMGLVAAHKAMEDTGRFDAIGGYVAVLIGTAWGTAKSIKAYADTTRKLGPEFASPNGFPLTVSNCLGGFIAMYKGLIGPNVTFMSGRTAAADAIGYAWRLIKNGTVDMALAGGIEEYSNMRLRGCEEQDEDRLTGEGAAFMVLEDMENAIYHAERIYGEVLGYGSGGVDNVDAALTMALKAAGLKQNMVRISAFDDITFAKTYGDMEGATAAVDMVGIFRQGSNDVDKVATVYADDGHSAAMIYRAFKKEDQ